MRRLAMVCAVAAVAVSWSCGHASAAPVAVQKRDFGKVLRVPLPAISDSIDPMEIYAESVDYIVEAKLEEAFCTTEDFSDKVLGDLDKAYRLLPVAFGTPDHPADPIGDARDSEFGDTELTNDVRHQLCDKTGSSPKDPYPAASLYYVKLAGYIETDGITALPGFAERSQDKQRKAVANLWAVRTGALRSALSKWLPTGF